jgi:hypothetical protein
MSNRDYEYQEIGSLSVHEFRQLMRECLAEQNTKPEPEAEPVAWYHPSGDGYDSNFRDHEVVKSCTGNPWTGWIPLYTGPEPVREPMSFRLLGLISELTVGNS